MTSSSAPEVTRAERNVMNTHRTVNGVRYHVVDDADTLLCKLQNKADDYYYDNMGCDIDKVESDIDVLEKAISENDIKAMDKMISEYHQLFKRYQ